MKTRKIWVFAASLALATPLAAQTIATVNGKAITQAQSDQFVQLLLGQGAVDSPQLREQVKQELIGRQLALQAAEKAKLGEQESVKQEIALMRESILVRALLTDHLEKNPITDAQVQAEYDTIKATQAERKEYKVRHILVSEQKQAEELTQAIQKKTISFEDAAKRDSIDAGSGQNGGDLGWAPATNYVPEFSQAVEKMQKGEMTQAPVQSQFGWHIIQLEDARPLQFPPLEQVKPQIQERLRQQVLAQFQESLRKEATIQ